MLDQATADQILDVADRNGLDHAGLLAVVEVESRGDPFETDGETPRFLFERHIFRRELARRAPDKVAQADREGLAARTWVRESAYRDQGSSSARLRLLSRARAIDEECADRACSWGVGQVMGFNAESLGFSSAADMVDYMVRYGLPGQAEVAARFIVGRGLAAALNSGDDTTFARGYNGAGYKQNRYDEKLAAARRRWRGKLARVGPEPAPWDFLRDAPPSSAPVTHGGDTFPLRVGSCGDRVRELQHHLSELRYAVNLDGEYANLTRDMVMAWQADNGERVTGMVDQEQFETIRSARAMRPLSPERTEITEKEMREGGDPALGFIAWIKRIFVAICAFLGIDTAGYSLNVRQLSGLRSTLDGLGLGPNALVLVVLFGLVVLFLVWRVQSRLVDEKRNGRRT